MKSIKAQHLSNKNAVETASRRPGRLSANPDPTARPRRWTFGFRLAGAISVACLAWILLTLGVVVIGSGPTSASTAAANGDGLLLYHLYDQTGRQYQPALGAAEAPEGLLGYLPLPLVLEQGQPTQIEGRAIYRNSAGESYLLDVTSGLAQKLEFPEGSTSKNFSFSPVGPWAFAQALGDTVAYLVNLESGQISPLVDPVEEIERVAFDQFSPDGNYVLFSVDDQVRLVSTADPRLARRLGEDNSAGTSFSGDGQQLIYQRRLASGEVELVLEQVDGSGSRVIAAGPPPTGAEFTPNPAQVLIYRPGQLSLLSLADGQERVLAADLPFGQISLRFAPAGDRALFGAGSYYWSWLDLQPGTAQRIEALNGYDLASLGQDIAGRWLFLKDVGQRSYLSFDLETGQVHEILKVDGFSTIARSLLTMLPPDGKFGLLTLQETFEDSQLWLLLPDQGEARLLAEADQVHGAFSPDRQWVALSTLDLVAGKFEATLELMALEGQARVSVGPGFGAVWVRPTGKLATLSQDPPMPFETGEPYVQVWTWLGGNAGRLGPPLGPAITRQVAWQHFEGGLMHWGGANETAQPQIHVLNSGEVRSQQTWERFADTWTEGSQPYACAEARPPLGPRRGFGQVWCQAQPVRAALGQPLTEERNEAAGYQTFRGGLMLWSPTEEGVYVLFDEGDWRWASLAEVAADRPLWQTWPELGSDFRHLTVAPDGAVWALGPAGLVHFDGQDWQTWPGPAEWQPSIYDPGDLAATSAGRLWLGSGGVYRFDSQSWTRYGSAEGLPDEPVRGLAVDAQDQVWVITSNVLSRFDGRRWQPVPVQDSPSLSDLAATPEGTVWLAVSGSGLYQFDGQYWTIHNRGNHPELPSTQYAAWVTAGPGDIVWVGTDTGWARWKDQAWQPVQTSIPAPFSYPMAVDAAGGVWGPASSDDRFVDLNEAGAVYHNLTVACRFTAAEGLNGPPLQPRPDFNAALPPRPDRVTDIAAATDGSVWFIAGGQIAVFRPQGPVCDDAAPAWVRTADTP